jgi:hypothetical protein
MHTFIAVVFGVGVWVAAFKLRSIPAVDRRVQAFWAKLNDLLVGRK